MAGLHNPEIMDMDNADACALISMKREHSNGVFRSPSVKAARDASMKVKD